MTPRSLYLHIPFCRRKCFYCDFAITTGGNALQERYIEVLCKEIALMARAYTASTPLATVFFGGGTPSLLTPMQIQRLLTTVDRELGIAPDAEISLEANPGTVTAETLASYRAAGVNRISLGAQAFQQELLDVCGRGHSVADIDDAIAAICIAGINNFGLDLISGLPYQTLDQWRETLQTAIAVRPTHLSVYDLALEPATAFGKRFQEGMQPLPLEGETVAMYRLARDMLREAGYDHYEISNYALPGYPCRHNRTYWLNQPFYGAGMGATSYIDRQRCDRPRKMRDYLQMVEDWEHGGNAPSAPVLSAAEELFDTLMQGLRLEEGIALERLAAIGDRRLLQIVLECVKPYIEKGLAALTATHLLLVPPEGWLLSNEVVADLYERLLEE